MDIQAIGQLLGNYGEFVGAVAVVVTLAYLSIQIRRSTAQARSDALVALNTIPREFQLRMADDPEIARIMLSAASDWKRLSFEEQFRAHMYTITEVQVYESFFHMMKEGQLDEKAYHSREGHIARRLSSPGARYWWEHYAYNLDPDFKERINRRLNDPASLPPMEDVPFFEADKW